METFLTSTSYGVLDTGRMPSSDTSDLAETLVSLARQLLGVPTAGNTLVTVTLGDTDAVDHLVLVEDLFNWDLLLEVFASPVDLLGDGTSVDLDFHDLSLLVAVVQDLDLKRKMIINEITIDNIVKETYLSVGNDADDRAVLLDLGQIGIDGLLAFFILPFLGVLSESLLLGFVPAKMLVNPHVKKLTAESHPCRRTVTHAPRGRSGVRTSPSTKLNTEIGTITYQFL